MWVVKLGGSLAASEALTRWLEVLSRAGAGKVVIVPGGGPFADAVRAAQAQWRFDDLTAHRMALAAMDQFGLMLCGIAPPPFQSLPRTRSGGEGWSGLPPPQGEGWSGLPPPQGEGRGGDGGLTPATTVPQIRQALETRFVPVWLPSAMLAAQSIVPATWDVSSDSLAAWLARKLCAKRLVLVKSCALPPAETAELARQGVVDPAFPSFAAGAEVILLNRNEFGIFSDELKQYRPHEGHRTAEEAISRAV